jgi:broad specificity phosphatase PhoE
MSETTRWWWIRHAPVDSGGRIYGQGDLPANCSDFETFAALARLLPPDALWVVSQLRRTHQTAEAIRQHLKDATDSPEFLVEPQLAEQHFGAWQGLSHDELARRRDGAWHRFWLAPAAEAPPGGESFVQVVTRVGATVQRLSGAHAGRDIVAVAHGGTIRAALSLALALDPERALALSIDNCSLTRIDHIAGAAGSHAEDQADKGVWRVVRVNQPARMPG